MSSSTAEGYPQLLSLAVHEFRTPASVVGGYLRMLQRDAAGELNDRQRKMIDEAEKSCARLVALIAELSDVSKLDSGAIALARQPVDVFALVSDVAEHVQEARDREVRLEVQGENGAARLTGDPTRLRSAFDAVFRAVLREKAGPCVVIAERRRETRDGQPRPSSSSAKLAVCKPCTSATATPSTKSAAASASRCRSRAGSSKATVDASRPRRRSATPPPRTTRSPEVPLSLRCPSRSRSR